MKKFLLIFGGVLALAIPALAQESITPPSTPPNVTESTTPDGTVSVEEALRAATLALQTTTAALQAEIQAKEEAQAKADALAEAQAEAQAKENTGKKKRKYVTPRLLTIEAGIPVGIDLGAIDSGAKDMVNVGRTFGVSLRVMDNLYIGYDSVWLYSTGTDSSAVSKEMSFDALRISYSFIPVFGAAVSVGVMGGDDSINSPVGFAPAMGIGFYSNLLPKEILEGFTSTLKLRLDYLFPAAGIEKGRALLNVGICFGL